MNTKKYRSAFLGMLILVIAAGFVPVSIFAQGHNDPVHGDPGGGSGGTTSCPCGGHYAVNDAAKRSFFAWIWARLAYAEGTHGGDPVWVCDACPLPDVCANLSGTQTSVPAGYVQVGSDCYVPPTASLSASPATVSWGQSSTLVWGSTNASYCTGTNFDTGGASTGSVDVTPDSDTTYSVSCAGPGGTDSANASVSVVVPTASLTSSPNPVEQGATSTLTWSSANAASCAGTGFSTGGAVSGSASVSPATTSAYSVSCANGYGHAAVANETVTVLAPGLSLTAAPPRLVTGQSSVITWTGVNIRSCTLTNEETGAVVDQKSSTTTGTLSGTYGTGALGHDAPFVLVCKNSVNTFATSTLVVPITPIFKGYL